mgnify:CR=1 FL=1
MADCRNKNPQEKQKLIDLRETLRLTLIEVATANQKNEVLLKQALELLDYDMTLVKSMRQAPTTANYTKNAYSASGRCPPNMKVNAAQPIPHASNCTAFA